MTAVRAPGRDWWPGTPEALSALQHELAELAARVSPWKPGRLGDHRVAALFVGSHRRLEGAGAAGDPAWAAAVLFQGARMVEGKVVPGVFAAPYEPGLLALREGRLLEQAARAVNGSPDVLLVNATGRDHPRRAGLALHLGAALDLPSIGVTDRPLLAHGPDPDLPAGSAAELRLEGELVGYRLRTRRGVRPVAVHAGWRVGPEPALELVRSLVKRSRTPEPLRQARRLARTARSL